MLFQHKCIKSITHTLMDESESSLGLVSCPRIFRLEQPGIEPPTFRLVDELLTCKMNPIKTKILNLVMLL